MNKNQYIEQFLTEYIELTEPPYFAVLLNGPWGSGKTWFIKNFKKKINAKYCEQIKDEKGKSSKFLYVSLNGVSSFQEVEDLFFEQLHPFLADKKVKIVGKILRGAIKATLKVDLNDDEKSDGSITYSLPNENLINSIISNEHDRTLIFDDLERCPIPIKNVLGYINQFVEEKGLKVILLANENEIVNNSKTERGEDQEILNPYKEIKEKVIGHTFTIQPDFDEAYSSFVKKTKETRIQQFFKEKKEVIYRIYYEANYNNLRHLRQSLWDFERFIDLLPENCTLKEKFIEHVLQLFFAISFELKKGAFLPEEVNKMITPVYVKGHETQIREKYYVFKNYPYPPFDNGFWQIFFTLGTLEKEKFKESVTNSYYFLEESRENWQKLWHYTELEDDEFHKLKEEQLKLLKEKKLDDHKAVLHLSASFLQFIDLGWIQARKDEVIKYAIEQLDELKEKNKIHSAFSEQTIRNGWGNSDSRMTNVDFQNILEHFIKINHDLEEKSLEEEGLRLIQYLETDPINFARALQINSQTTASLKPILPYISPSVFASKLIAVPNNKQELVYTAIWYRYQQLQINQSFLQELQWLKNLKIDIAGRLEDLKDQKKVIKSSYLERFIDQLLDIIQRMEAYKRHLSNFPEELH